MLLHCKPERNLVHHTKNRTFKMQNESYEFFFLNDGFTVAVSVEKGEAVSYYCNIAKPSVFSNDVLSFVDFDLDYVKRKMNGWEAIDEDEFVKNSIKYEYSGELTHMLKMNWKN